MAELVAQLEWGTLEGGFAWVDGVFRETFPWCARGEAMFVSSHGAVVSPESRIPYEKPLKFLAPARRENRQAVDQTPDGMTLASERDFALADLTAGRYSLFEDHTGLFRAFASLKTSDDILGFANRYGPLGADASVAIVDVVPEEPWKMGLVPYWAEPLMIWQQETRRMATVVGLWDLIRESGASAFSCEITDRKAMITVAEGNAYIAPTDGAQWIIASADKTPERFEKLKGLDSAQWPHVLLSELVSEGLRGRVDMTLRYDDGAASTGMAPRGLIGGLWLQAALAIGGDKAFNRCQVCGTWFEVMTRQGRKDKRYCSDACRMRAYRQRHKEEKA